MKHPWKFTLMILAMFLVAQFVGLAVIQSYDSYFGKKSQLAVEQGELVKPEVSVVQQAIPPEVELKTTIDVVSLITSLIIAIIIAAFVFFLLSRIKTLVLIRVWFSVVIFITLTISFTLLLYPVFSAGLFSVFGKKIAIAEMVAVALALIVTFYKVVKRNIIIHNIGELFVYPGLAVIFLPLLNVIAAVVLLIVIAVYDVIAVWKSNFMVKLAKISIEKIKIFPGLLLPYGVSAKDKIKIKKYRAIAKKLGKTKSGQKKLKEKAKKMRIKMKMAILGGGDIAFPIIFSGTVLFAYGLLAAIITTLCAALSLFLLLIVAKDKAYPAMVYITPGCLIGLLLVLLII